MENNKNEVVIFTSENLALEVRISPNEETVWLTQEQMAKLFQVDRTRITRHTKNIFDEGELDKVSVCAENAHTAPDGKTYIIKFYNLDMILAVGYRVNSKMGTLFRKWANAILKQYLIKGFSVNQKRIISYQENYLEFNKAVKTIANMANKSLTKKESLSLLGIISKYSYALETLDKYDYQELTINSITKDDKSTKLNYEEAMKQIKMMPQSRKSQLFGKEKENGFSRLLDAVYQTAFGEDVYPSIEEKAANLLYFTVKDHPFIDGNKRIAAAIFLWFMDIYNILIKEDGSRIIEDNTLVAIVLMIALSNPIEKEIIIKIVINLINKNN